MKAKSSINALRSEQSRLVSRIQQVSVIRQRAGNDMYRHHALEFMAEAGLDEIQSLISAVFEYQSVMDDSEEVILNPEALQKAKVVFATVHNELVRAAQKVADVDMADLQTGDGLDWDSID